MRPEDAEALAGLLRDIDCLDELKRWMAGVNVFEVLKVADSEIRHSNMLAWLIDPNESHGLDGAVLSELVWFLVEEGAFPQENTLKLLLADWGSFSVFREWKHIDMLIVSDSDRVVIAIENKIWSSETPGQLDRYEVAVRNKFKDYRKAFLFLTPDGEESSNPETWRSICYSDVVGMIERAMAASNAVNDVRMIVNQYLEMLRRNIVEDEELERICLKIYRQHQAAFDLIIEHLPDEVQQISDIVDEWCLEKQGEGRIEYLQQWSRKGSRLFISPKLKERFPAIESACDSLGTPYFAVYEVSISRRNRAFYMHPRLSCPKGTPIGRKQAMVEYARKYEPNWLPSADTWRRKVVKGTLGVGNGHKFGTESPEDQRDEIWRTLDHDLDVLLAAERAWDGIE